MLRTGLFCGDERTDCAYASRIVAVHAGSRGHTEQHGYSGSMPYLVNSRHTPGLAPVNCRNCRRRFVPYPSAGRRSRQQQLCLILTAEVPG
ncbi:hypothetical protein KCP69_19575 [Salmonella enterica subsp. enterica]|nr:hypothetical protein KCP69_19575 [Salmonella enterica subsp. enterica]